MRCAKWAAIFFLMCRAWSSSAQYSAPIHFGVKDGLPSNAAYCSAQDKEGFMWIGTDVGLVRYDGEHFITYTKRDGLPDNEVLGIISDTVTGRLWLTTFSRVPCYYRKGKIYTPANDSSLRVIKCPFGEFITGNRQGDKVFLFNGSYIYECTHDTIIPLEHMATSTGIYGVSWWGGDHYDLLNEHGITANRTNGSQRIYAASGIDSSEYGVWFDRTLARFYVGKIIFYKKRQDGEYERDGEVSLPLRTRIIRVIEYPQGYLFFASDQGIFSVNKKYQDLRKVWDCKGTASIMLDRLGNLWVTSGMDGIYVFRPERIASLRPYLTGTGNNITSVNIGTRGQMIIGNSEGKIFRLDGDTLLPAAYATLRPAPVRRVLDMDSLVLMVTNECEIADIRTGRTRYYHTLSGGPKNILKLRDGRTVLIGQIGSMLVYDIPTRHFHEVHTFKRVFDMAQRSDGQVMVSTIDGLYAFEHDTMRHIIDKDPAMGSRLSSLCYTPDDLLWAGTPSDGVIVYNGHKVLGHINSSLYPAYHGAICRKVAAGQANEVWTATNYGINKITYHIDDSLVVDNIIPYTTVDGLLSDDVNDIMIADSCIYIATSAGLSILPHNNLSVPVHIPVYITSIRVNDKDSTIHDAVYPLRYDQNNLRIDYVGISMPKADNLRYQYRLLGAGNDAWTTTTNSSIEFRSLSPGRYIFEVTVLDKFGHRSPSTARVRFEITPAFYTTWWFWAIIMINILVVGFLIIRGRFRRQQRRFEHEQSLHNKIIELEQQALKAQMNPHFIFNCLTAVQHFVNTEDMYSANMYLSNFARLIRKTLDLSGEQYISLDQEISYLEDYVQMECLRFGDKFIYIIDVPGDIDTFSTEVPPMLLQPIVENAIRHGLRNLENKAGKLLIDFVIKDDVLYCTVDDNGIGRAKAREMKTTSHVEYQSKGMALTEMRIQAINQISAKKIRMEVKDKYDDNNQSDGTLFILAIEQ